MEVGHGERVFDSAVPFVTFHLALQSPNCFEFDGKLMLETFYTFTRRFPEFQPFFILGRFLSGSLNLEGDSVFDALWRLINIMTITDLLYDNLSDFDLNLLIIYH